MEKETGYENLTIKEIAKVIIDNNIKVHPWAKPYFEAMQTLNTLSDNYGADTGSSMVSYFLANAGAMQGPIMRNVKLELNNRLKKHRR